MAKTRDDYYQEGANAYLQGDTNQFPAPTSWQQKAWCEGWETACEGAPKENMKRRYVCPQRARKLRRRGVKTRWDASAPAGRPYYWVQSC